MNKVKTGVPFVLPVVAILAVLMLAGADAQAEVFIYVGPAGDRMLTDRPQAPAGYMLISEQTSIDGAGYVLAGRAPSPARQTLRVPRTDAIATGGPWQFRHLIARSSARHRVDPALVEAIIDVESAFNPRAVSRRGAIGLMQLIDSTARMYDVHDRFDPASNISAGVRHLRHLLDEFDGHLTHVMAAYNAGENAVKRYGGVPPFAETQRYVMKVERAHARYTSLRARGAGDVAAAE